MTHKAQDQLDHMLTLQGLSFTQAGAVFENHAKSVPIRDIEKSER
jgi:hypothetical protein